MYFRLLNEPGIWSIIISMMQFEGARFPSHHNDVIMSERFKSSAYPVFAKPFIRAQIKENIKALRHWPLYGEFTGDHKHQ